MCHEDVELSSYFSTLH